MNAKDRNPFNAKTRVEILIFFAGNRKWPDEGLKKKEVKISATQALILTSMLNLSLLYLM